MSRISDKMFDKIQQCVNIRYGVMIMDLFMERKTTRQIAVGNVLIGGKAPISIQSMTNTTTADFSATVKQIDSLAHAGCDIVRFTVMDQDDADAIIRIKKMTTMPLIADIHFDHSLALKAIRNGIDGLRLNPGNIGSEDKVRQIVALAQERNIPIRIGVNSGSLPKDLLAQYGVCSTALVEAALRHVAILERNGFYQIKISVKASDVDLMLQSYRQLSEKCNYPLHLGVTEAGSIISGTVKSAYAIGTLLREGIGDTIRVSLTAKPEFEVKAALEILKTVGLRKGLNIISCPTCGRTKIDVIRLTARVEKALEKYRDKPLTIAVMGCAVNGPGEAKEADFGIAGGIGEGLLFAKGKVIKKIPESEIVQQLVKCVSDSCL